MSKRIVTVESTSELRFENNSLVFSRENSRPISIPIEDIGVLVLENLHTMTSTALLSACCSAQVAVVVCSPSHLPHGLLLSLDGHVTQSAALKTQVRCTATVRNRIWQEIVRAKIRSQSELIMHIRGADEGIGPLARRVRTGDTGNVEARAARIYWQALFGTEFRRMREGPAPNSLLNYGYALLRASVARAITGAGLHPGLGVHHHNQYNAYCLADDLMEPLRPLVDQRVHEIRQTDLSGELKPLVKRELLRVLTRHVIVRGTPLPLFEGLERYAASARGAMEHGAGMLEIPDVSFPKLACEPD